MALTILRQDFHCITLRYNSACDTLVFSNCYSHSQIPVDEHEFLIGGEEFGHLTEKVLQWGNLFASFPFENAVEQFVLKNELQALQVSCLNSVQKMNVQ
jgi:hypothetical protein